MLKKRDMPKDWKLKNKEPQHFIPEEEKELHQFVRDNLEDVSVFMQTKTLDFLVDLINKNIVLFTRELLLEKDLDEVKVTQGIIQGHKKSIYQIEEIKNLRKKL